MRYPLGIIGGGNMAEAIVRGLLRVGPISAEQIILCDPSPSRRAFFDSELAVKSIDNAAGVARASDMLLLSVKPQSMPAVLDSIRGQVNEQTIVVSIAAGVTTKAIEGSLGASEPKVIRAMPNTPLTIGAGATAIASGSFSSADDLKKARTLFEASSLVFEVREDQLDAVTALSGSGPAYIFFLVEIMADAGVKLGLQKEIAEQLARQTAYGASLMLQQSTESPAVLRKRVTSPGGTTQAAIQSMEADNVDVAITRALIKARDRGRELSEPSMF